MLGEYGVGRARSWPADRAWCPCSRCGSRTSSTSSTSPGSPSCRTSSCATTRSGSVRQRRTRWSGWTTKVADSVPLLTLSTPYIGHFQIRTRGTLGGAIAHADPAAEYAAVALALDATMEATSSRGRREIPATEFFTGLWETSLGADEILTRRARSPCGARTVRFRDRGIRPPPRRFRHRGRRGSAGTRRRRPGGTLRNRATRPGSDAAARLRSPRMPSSAEPAAAITADEIGQARNERALRHSRPTFRVRPPTDPGRGHHGGPSLTGAVREANTTEAIHA